MKRLIALLALTAALIAGAGTASAAAPTEPPSSLGCLDINGGTGFSWDGASFSGSISLTEPACKQATYTLVVLDDATSTTPLTTITGTPGPTGTSIILFNGTVTDADGVVCVYATSAIGGRIFDVGAPDGQTCLEVDTSGSSGGTSFH
jgi:hypothetical protein